MLHIIIFTQFFCFALGIGVFTLCWTAYRNTGKKVYRDGALFELFFALLMFTDTLRIYSGKIIKDSLTDDIALGICGGLLLILIGLLFHIFRNAKSSGLAEKVGLVERFLVGVTLLTAVLFIGSAFLVQLRVVPYMLLIYLLQGVLGILFLSKKREPEPGSDEGEGSEKTDEAGEERSLEMELLTKRENEILEFLLQGLSNQEIADKLFISSNTVKNHVYNIYKKLDVKNKVELINLVNKGV